MTTQDNPWALTAARIIYEAYPDCDLLPIEPPFDEEGIREFSRRAEHAGDTLFLFICREANDEIDAREFKKRVDRAIRDLQCVRDAFADRDTSDLGPPPTSDDSRLN